MEKVCSYRRFILIVFFALMTMGAAAQPAAPQDKAPIVAPGGESTAEPAQPGIELSPQVQQTPQLVNPASSSPNGRHEPGTIDKHDAALDWAKDGSVGQSTFMDRVRKMTWVLAFICLLIWALSKVTGKSVLEKFGAPVESGSLIEVLEKKRLSPGRSVMLMKAGPKVLVVASTEGGMRTLTEIPEEDFKRHQASQELRKAPLDNGGVQESPKSTFEVARHYLSIIPGLGVKRQ